jgi:solute carrier family 25 oxoglutarate transporter 11
MSSGLLYSVITMPLESAKNRMAFQQPGPDGVLPYRTTVQTLRTIAAKEGVMTLWSGFLPYYGRCGGHSVTMFVFVEVLRDMYKARVAEKADPIA